MKHRFLSMVLVLCMVVGLLPSTMLQTEAKANIATTVVNDGGTGDGSSSTTTTTDNSTLSETAEHGAATIAEDLYYDFEGLGTKESPFLITSKPDLEGLAHVVNGGGYSRYNNSSIYYLVQPGASISTTVSIGTSSNHFNANFDGSNSSITATIDEDQSNGTIRYLGLFGYIGSTGVVENVKLSSSSKINVDSAFTFATSNSIVSDLPTILLKATFAGGIAGYNDGRVINCSVSGTVDGDVDFIYYEDETIVDDAVVGYTRTNYSGAVFAGGIVGYNAKEVYNSTSNATVNAAIGITASDESGTKGNPALPFTASGSPDAYAYAGGVAGYNSGTIINNYNTGAVTATADVTALTNLTSESYAYAGGVVGLNASSKVSNNFTASGAIHADASTASPNNLNPNADGDVASGTAGSGNYWQQGTVKETIGDGAAKEVASDSSSFTDGGVMYANAGTLLHKLQNYVITNELYDSTTVFYGEDSSTTKTLDLYRLKQWDGAGTNLNFVNRINAFAMDGTALVSPNSSSTTSNKYGVVTLSPGYPTATGEVQYLFESTVTTGNNNYLTTNVRVAPASGMYNNYFKAFDATKTTSTDNDFKFNMMDRSAVILVDFLTLSTSDECGAHSGWKGLQSEEAFKEAMQETGNYFLQENITLSNAVAVSGTVQLCLNGYTLSYTSDSALTIVGEDTVLSICGNVTGTGKTNLISGSGTAVVVNGGTFNFKSGNIAGNSKGVYVNGGTFYMTGGTIEKNTQNVDVQSGIMKVSASPIISSNGNGVNLASGQAIQVTSAGLTDASIYVNAGDDTLIAKAETEGFDVSGYKDNFSARTTVFYRDSKDALYTAQVTPTVDDFKLTMTVSDTNTKDSTRDENNRHYFITEYTGSAMSIDAVYTVNKTNPSVKIIWEPTKVGQLGPTDADDYTLSVKFENHTYFKDGTYHIGNLTITPKNLSFGQHYTASYENDNKYTGDAIKPPVTITSLMTGIDLVEGRDYTLDYGNYVNVGYGYITVIGMGNYTFIDPETNDNKKLRYDILPENAVLVLNMEEIDDLTQEYGDRLEVKATPYLNSKELSEADLENCEMVLYKVEGTKEIPISEVVPIREDGVYVIDYYTSAKLIGIGTHDLLVKFTAENVGESNIYVAEKGFTYHLVEKPLVATVGPGISREYNGSAIFNIGTEDMLMVSTDDVAQGSDTTKLIEGKDSVFATATGYVASPDVYDRYELYVTDVELSGTHAMYYSLVPEAVVSENTVEIKAKSLNDSDVTTKINVEVMKGQGTFTTPEVTYTVGNEVFAIPGVLTYTTEGFTTHAEIEAHLKTLDVNGVLTVAFRFVPDNADNFKQEYVTGAIIFKVVDIMFSGIDEAIVIPDAPIYGDANNFFYDPSKFIAQVGTDKTTTGAYFLTVTDSLGATVEDLSIMKVGTYNYSVTFSSYDSAYTNVSVVKGSFGIGKRAVEYTWDSQTFAYDSTEKAPTATITNVVWVDDVSIAVTGAQINVGSYSGTLALAGADKSNYELANETVTFVIEPSTAKGIVTVSTADNDSSNTLSPGDVLTADVSAVSPAGGTVFYHWYRNDVLMSSATWPTYTLSASDTDGTTIRCTVSFSGNTTGEISSTSMSVGNTFFTGSVLITHKNGVLTATVAGTNTDSYTIYWTGVNASSTGETYTMDVADYGNNVSATVIATETSGYSGSISSSINVTAVKPDVPEIVVTPGNTTAAVQWESIFHGGSALKDFKLSVTNESGKNITGSPFSLASTLTSFTVTGLTNGHVYCFQLTAENGVGESTSVAVYATPGETDTDTDTNGDITTTTTTTVYTDSSGATVTKTVTIEANTTTGEVKTTTLSESEGEDGTIITETATETVGQSGEVLETTHEYILESTDMSIKANVADTADGSEGTLVVETETSDSIALLANMVKKVADKDESTITLITPNADITFDNDALDAIFASGTITSTSTIEIVAELTSSLVMPNHVQDRLQTAFIVDLTLKLNGKPVSDFGDGVATVKLPYTRNDTSKGISVYHVADSGTMTRMDDGVYVNSDKMVNFTTSHFSYYAVLEESSIFTDVKADDWYYNAVLWAVEEDITSGTTATTFSPGVDCTRSQAMALLWKAMGKEIAHITIPFEDLSATDYFYEAVRWAYNRGITDGTSPKRFSPDQECTRSQIITFLWIANGKPIVDAELYFSDVATGIWYEEAVRWAVSEGITGGTNSAGTRFSPDQVCTRAEIVTFLYSNMHL